MKNLFPIIILIFITLHPCLSNAKEQDTPTPLILPNADFSEMRKEGIATVEQVINPMTIKLTDGRMIALAGLDFPDLDFYDPGKLAVTTQKILEDFLTEKKVIIYQTKKSDRGRINRMEHHIAQLARKSDNPKSDDTWVQGMLLSLGLARVRTTKYNPEMANQMLELEKEARTKHFGLWNIEDYNILTPETSANHIGSFQIIEGTIESIGSHKNNLYINFGKNWRTDFTIGIGGGTMRKFSQKHIYPRQWNNTTVRVRGWIESYNGPFIELTHPERIEILSTDTTTQKPEDTTQKKAPSIMQKGSALPKYNE